MSADPKPSESLTEPLWKTCAQAVDNTSGQPGEKLWTKPGNLSTTYPQAERDKVASYELFAVAYELLLHAVITCGLFAIASRLHLT